MNSPIEEIKKAVAENRASDALSRLLELSQNNKQLHDAIHIVLAEFNNLTSQRLKGTLDNSEATRRLNVIHDKILVALGAFDSQGRVLPGSGASKLKSSSSNAISNLTLLTLALAGFTLINERGGDAQIAFGILTFCAFIGLLLALVVSASKK